MGAPKPSPTPASYDYSDTYWYGCAYGGTGVELQLESRIVVHMLGDLVVPMKRAEIRLANRRILKSGVPILVGTLGLALEL